MGVLDLDAARKARAAKSETGGKPHDITVDGETFTIPVEMPLDAALAISDGHVALFFEELLNGQHEAFAKHKISVDDLLVLVEGVSEMYGLDNLGEALASRASSSNTSKRSRPTSKRTTT